MIYKNGLRFENQKMKSVQDHLEEITRFGSMEDWEKVSKAGIKAAKALYL